MTRQSFILISQEVQCGRCPKLALENEVIITTLTVLHACKTLHMTNNSQQRFRNYNVT